MTNSDLASSSLRAERYLASLPADRRAAARTAIPVDYRPDANRAILTPQQTRAARIRATEQSRIARAIGSPVQSSGFKVQGSSLLAILIFSVLSVLSCSSRAATITGLVYQVATDIPLNTKLTFTPTNVVYLSSAGPGLQLGGPLTISITNGVIAPTKIDAGDYLVSTPLLQWRKPFPISVWQTTNTLDLTNFLSTPLIYGRVAPPPNNFIQYEESGQPIAYILIEP